MRTEEGSGGIEPARAYGLDQLVDYAEGAVVSRTLAETEHGTLTLFAFDGGQHLSEHTTPFDAYVVGLDGRGLLVIGGEEVPLQPGQLVLMPADVPHAVRAPERFKMLLVMLR